MKELIEKTPFRIRSVRVDNKFGKKFKEFCASIGIAVITNDPYSPEQNGKIERWHKTEKQECIYKYCKFTDSLDQINYQLQLYLHYYNYQRRHSGFWYESTHACTKNRLRLEKFSPNHLHKKCSWNSATIQNLCF